MTDRLKKAGFSVEISDQMKAKTARLTASLQKDPDVQRLFQKKGIPMDLVEKKPWMVDRWRKGIFSCGNCHGLKECRQKLKGYAPDLLYDGILQESFTPCRYMREKVQNERHLGYYRINDLPAEMRTISFSDIEAGHESNEYLQTVSALFDACRAGKGVYLYGKMGTGKTYLAACAANEQARGGSSVSFAHYPSFVQRLASGVRDGEYREQLEDAMYSDFLVLDDIGAENVTEWNRDSILLPLLNYRYEEKKPVWFTSNCDLSSLELHLTFSRNHEDSMKAKRIMERISHMASVHALTGEDRRKFM